MVRPHLSQRKHIPFNLLSKSQERYFVESLNEVYDEIHGKYKGLRFSTNKTLSIDHILEYLNRARKIHGISLLTRIDIEADNTKADGLKPDGGIWFVESKKDSFPLIFFVLEVKHQGLYTGYKPISESDWKKKRNIVNDAMVLKDEERPPQAQGNAIERFAKNLNAFKTLNELYEFNPYVIFCDGFDFFMKEEYDLFKHQKYAERYRGTDSSIRMRLIAGNCFKALNEIYITGESVGHIKIYPATIMARMKQWEKGEIKSILHKSIEKSLKHLKSIDEI